MTPTESKAALVSTAADDEKRTALLQALGFDRLNPGQRELALAISGQYDLDPMLRHVVMVDGKPYITRDGLLHVAHKSGDFDGIEVEPPTLDADGKYWRTTCKVYRKSFSRPFVYPGRYPATGGNAKYNEEMAIKVAEVMTLRRAFDVSAPVIEERWDGDIEEQDAAPQPTSLAERVAQRALAAGASAQQPVADVATPDETSAPVAETPVPLPVEIILGELDRMGADPTIEEAQAILIEDMETEDAEEEPEPPKVVSPLRAPEPDDEALAPGEALFKAPAAGFAADPTVTSLNLTAEDRAELGDGPDALAAFKVWAKDHNTTLIRSVARELFPNATGFSQLQPKELGVIQHEVTKAEMAQADAAVNERCGAGSPLTNNKCTLDPGHKGVHRHGTRESWDNE
jgi:hypothetical protein